MNTKERIEYLQHHVPEVARAMDLYRQCGNYEACLERAVIELAEKSEHLVGELVRARMNLPVTITVDRKDIERGAINAKMGE